MFLNVLGMMGNYADRKVDRYTQGELTISTAEVTDGAHPYETAVSHPLYNEKDWVIVECYDTKEEAQNGHNKWVKKMTSKKLPKELVDCGNSEISQLANSLGKLKFPKRDTN